MRHWPDQRLLNSLRIEIPIVQAPMAGSDSIALARSVSSTGALGSLACALLSPDAVDQAMRALRQEMSRPFNLNFFCHALDPRDSVSIERWKRYLKPHYDRWNIDIDTISESRLRMPFDDEMCSVVEELEPEVVSFHFGLPTSSLVDRLKRRGTRIVSSATSVIEAEWLEARGCDVIIAQGYEAGGHRAMFLENNIASQSGLFALLPQITDAVSLPVIAAGGIADARGVVAAFALGASGVQLGTAYLLCPEANLSPLYRQALSMATENKTALTNLFTGRPARGILNRFLEESGPMSDEVPAFPYAATLVAPLRAASERAESFDYLQMWAGQAARLAKSLPAAELTRNLAADALRYWDERFGL